MLNYQVRGRKGSAKGGAISLGRPERTGYRLTLHRQENRLLDTERSGTDRLSRSEQDAAQSESGGHPSESSASLSLGRRE